MIGLYTSLFFASTTAVFIVLWAKARQDCIDWRRMSQCGFELAIEEMEKEQGAGSSSAAGQQGGRATSAHKINVVVRERRWN